MALFGILVKNILQKAVRLTTIPLSSSLDNRRRSPSGHPMILGTMTRAERVLASWVAFLIVGLSLAGCFEKPLSPVAPVWDVQVNVPLVNRTYTVNELVEKDPTLLHTDGSGLLVYTNSQQFSPIGIRNDLKVDPASDTYQSRIGTFKIKSPSSKIRKLSAGELNPALGVMQGQSVVVPSFSFSVAERPFPIVAEVQQATIASGQVVVTLINQLQVPIDNVYLTVQSQLGPLAQYDHAAAIQPSDSVKGIFSLANLRIGNSLSYTLNGHVPGGGGSVVVDTSRAVILRVDFPTEIEAYQAVAELPANTFTTSGGFAVDDSTRIDNAEVSVGSMTVTLNNSLGLSGQLSFTIPELLQQSNKPFTQVIPFTSKQQTIVVTYPLKGYSVQSPDGRLNYNVITQTYDTGDNLVTIDSSMMVFGSVATSVIYFERFQGTVKPTNISVSVSRSVDLGEMNRIFTGTVKVSQARVILTVTNPTRFAIDLNTAISGGNSVTGQSASLSIPQDQRRISYPQSTITLTETNSNIVSFLNSFSGKLPDQFTVAGDALLNPDYASGSVSASDSIGIGFSLEIPLSVGVVSGVVRDTNDVDIDSDARKEIDRTTYGKVTFEVENGLPASIEVSLDLLDAKRAELLTLPKASQPPVAVTGAQVDAQGRVIVPASSTTYLEVTADDISKFHPSEYVAYSMIIGTTGGGSVPVQFRSTDSVHVRAYSTLNYRVNSK
jgi:hypothetical protein